MIDTAIILAGGLGTRLRPLTDDTPKPLLPVKGKPILHHIIDNLKKHNVTNIILSIGYKADQIRDYFKDGKQLGVYITYSIETEPLGTGGAIKEAAKHLHKPFFALNGDNLADFDYTALAKTHTNNKTKITLTLFPVEDVTQYGIAQLANNKIIQFIEKPKREEAPSNLNNAGGYLIEPDALNILPEGKSSIERDCFEKLAPQNKIGPYVHEGQWFPTDTLEKFTLACKQFLPIINLNEKKVIIADVDETICESCQEITDSMANAVNTLVNKGYTFAVISGTDTKELLRMISSKVTAEHHLLGNSGTTYSIKRAQEHQTMYNYSLSNTEKNEIKTAFQKTIAKFDIKSVTTAEDQLLDRDTQITLSAIGRKAPKELKAAFDPDGKKRQEWVAYLKTILDENKYEIRIGGTTSIDITHKGLDKEWGIRTFAQHHQIPLSSILFFGDKIYPNGNDFPASKIVDCIAVTSPEHTLQELQKIISLKQ